MCNKTRYIQILEEKNITNVLFQPWWLNSVCGNNWEVIIDEKQNGVRGFLVYFRYKSKGLTYVVTPRLALFNPFIIFYPTDLSSNKFFSYEQDVVNQICKKIPNADIIQIKMPYNTHNVLPFHWNGFELNVRYSFVIEKLNNLEDVYLNFKNSTKRNIKKAQDNYSLIDSDNIEAFYGLNQKSFKRQKKELPYTLEELEQLFRKSAEHESGKLWMAKNDKNEFIAGLFVVWDEERAYYVSGGIIEGAHNAGAMCLLFYNSFKYLANKTHAFDFEGSMHKGIAEFFSTFGAKPIPYFTVYKETTAKAKALQFIKNL